MHFPISRLSSGLSSTLLVKSFPELNSFRHKISSMNALEGFGISIIEGKYQILSC